MKIEYGKRLLVASLILPLVMSGCSMDIIEENTFEENDRGGDLVVKSHMYRSRKEPTNIDNAGNLTDILRKMDQEKMSGIWNVTGDKIFPNTDREVAGPAVGGAVGQIEGIPAGYSGDNYPKNDTIAQQLAATLPPMGNVVVPGTYVTSGWGWRNPNRKHDGMDLRARTPQPLTAPWDGTVEFADWRGGYGKLLIIDHGSGLKTRYAHLSKYEVSVGQKVTKDQLIAMSGSTGIGTGPHIHYEIRYMGNSRNPYYFFLGKDVTNLEAQKYNTGDL